MLPTRERRATIAALVMGGLDRLRDELVKLMQARVEDAPDI
jgi:hypothetical protein